MQRFMTELLSPSQIGPGEHEDVGGEHALLDLRPLVRRPAVLGHVGPHAGRDVVVDEPEAVGRDAVALHERAARVDERLRVGDLRASA